MFNPIITIVTPLFNRVTLVEETIMSMRAQTYPHWEMIVIDDGSTDGSYELVKKNATEEPRLRLLRRNRLPKGAPTCRNIGIGAAQGDFLIFLDSDDLLAPFCLERRVEKMIKCPTADFSVFASAFFTKEPGDDNRLWNISTDEDILRRFLRLDPPWQTMGPIYKTEFVRALGGFWEELHYWQDYELHVRALLSEARYKIYLDLAPDTYFRIEGDDRISKDVLSTEKIHSVNLVFSRFVDALDLSNYGIPLLKGLFKMQKHLAENGAKSSAIHSWKKHSSYIASPYNVWAGSLMLRSYSFRNTRILSSLRRFLRLFLTFDFTVSVSEHGKHRHQPS